MKIKTILPVALLSLVALVGCKVVKKADLSSNDSTPATVEDSGSDEDTTSTHSEANNESEGDTNTGTASENTGGETENNSDTTTVSENTEVTNVSENTEESQSQNSSDTSSGAYVFVNGTSNAMSTYTDSDREAGTVSYKCEEVAVAANDSIQFKIDGNTVSFYSDGSSSKNSFSNV